MKARTAGWAPQQSHISSHKIFRIGIALFLTGLSIAGFFS